MRLAREIVVPLLVGLLVALVQSVVPGASLTRLLVLGVVGAVVALVVVLVLERRVHRFNGTLLPAPTPLPAATPAPITLQAPQPPPKPTRIYVPAHVTPKFLIDQRRGLTSIQADSAIGVFIGKWISFSGIVSDIKRGNQGVGVLAHSDNGDVYVHMDFAESWIDHISMLGMGNTIAATGEIESVDTLAVFLEKCELLETPTVAEPDQKKRPGDSELSQPGPSSD
jgi:uncharacterized membrane protein YeaQ/YmgE (transglycosylase-associated protein family)